LVPRTLGKKRFGALGSPFARCFTAASKTIQFGQQRLHPLQVELRVWRGIGAMSGYSARAASSASSSAVRIRPTAAAKRVVTSGAFVRIAGVVPHGHSQQADASAQYLQAANHVVEGVGQMDGQQLFRDAQESRARSP